MSSSALMVAAHPPGRGSGASVRALLTRDALRSSFDRVDVVALASPGEEGFLAEGVVLIPRTEDPSLIRRVADLCYGGAYYGIERHAQLAKRLRALVAEGRLQPRYDLLWVGPQSVASEAAVDSIDASARVLDVDSVVAANVRRLAEEPGLSLPRRWFRQLTAAAIAREERRRCSSFDVVTVASELERERLGEVGTKVAIVPNAADAAGRVRPGETGRTLLFVGSLDYEANIEGLRWFVEGVLPRLRDVELTVAGRNPTEEVVRLCADGGATLVPNTPSLEPLYAAARVVVAPIRLGGGTRLKVLEAMAHGAATVATPVAAEGLQVEDGSEVYLADSADRFAARCSELLDDPGKAAALGSAARETWSRLYTPQIAKGRIVELVERLLASRSAQAVP